MSRYHIVIKLIDITSFSSNYHSKRRVSEESKGASWVGVKLNLPSTGTIKGCDIKGGAIELQPCLL